MALPTYATVLSQINTYIVANGNNEITANVLNPILELMLDFANNNIGDLDTLTTDEKNSIVEAINSLKQNFDDLVNNGVQLYTGINNPNITPPPTFNYADFYMQVDIDSLPVKLWQWNGFEWKDASLEPATETDNVTNNSDVPGVSATDALNNLYTNKEDKSNKATDFSIVNNTLYPSVEAVKTYADALLVGILDLRGSYDASTNLFPTTGGSGTAGVVLKGDLWYVSVAGVLAGKSVNIGDSFFAVIDTPGQTTGNWVVLESNIGYVPANDANVIHTTGNETKSGILTLSNQLRLSDGTNSNPSILFINDAATDTGINHNSDGIIDIVTNGGVFTSFKVTGLETSTATAQTVNIPAQTATTIASFDASKNIVSLSTSTYPSLAELTYVKGVTSAIQTQLNAKISGSGSSAYIPVFSGANTLASSTFTTVVGTGSTPDYLDLGTSTNTSTSVFDKLKLYLFKNPTQTYGLGVGQNSDMQYWAGSSSTGMHIFFTSQIERVSINSLGVFKINNLAGTGMRQVVADSSGNLSASSTAQPLVYRAILNQSGTGAPVATVLENTLGGTVVWARTGTGAYTGTLSGAFTLNKTVIFLQPTFSGFYTASPGGGSAVNINTRDTANALADNGLTFSSLQILVYP